MSSGCVCGFSNTYPICDKTHKKIGPWKEFENGDAFRIIGRS